MTEIVARMIDVLRRADPSDFVDCASVLQLAGFTPRQILDHIDEAMCEAEARMQVALAALGV